MSFPVVWSALSVNFASICDKVMQSKEPIVAVITTHTPQEWKVGRKRDVLTVCLLHTVVHDACTHADSVKHTMFVSGHVHPIFKKRRGVVCGLGKEDFFFFF